MHLGTDSDPIWLLPGTETRSPAEAHLRLLGATHPDDHRNLHREPISSCEPTTHCRSPQGARPPFRHHGRVSADHPLFYRARGESAFTVRKRDATLPELNDFLRAGQREKLPTPLQKREITAAVAVHLAMASSPRSPANSKKANPRTRPSLPKLRQPVPRACEEL